MSERFLDRVAERDAIGGAAGRQHHVDLVQAGGIEGRTETSQQLQDLAGRIGLDRVVDHRVRHRRPQLAITGGDHVEIDDEAGRGGLVIGEETGDFSRHCSDRPSCSGRYSTRKFLNCQGQVGSRLSSNSTPRSTSGVQSE